MQSSEEEKEMKSKFCERCYYLITNFTNEESFLDRIKLLELTSNPHCNFCFGIFNLDNYKEIISTVKAQIREIDHKDYKISFNFSAIFDIIHHYWRTMFANSKHVKNPKELDISMIRVVFKQIFLSVLEKGIHESFNPQSDTEVELSFEFSQSVYDDFNNMFKYLNKDVKLIPNDTIKSAVNMKKVISSLPGGLIKEIFKKFGFNDLASRNKDYAILVKNVKLIKDSLFLKGNYLKLTREIGQTKWQINGMRVCSSSVEEEIKKNLIKIFECDDCVMSAGGREDRDVRMLGNGRPFILEIINPKKNITDHEYLTKEINKSGLVKVNTLSVSEKNYFEEIKKYETSKMKYYSCFVWCKKVLSDEDISNIKNVKNMNVIQKTPFRVLHRRTLMDRAKVIYKMDATKINDHFLIVNILASAGTYIKEFVHSDLGRTKPSLVSLLNSECDILQLDVLDLILV